MFAMILRFAGALVLLFAVAAGRAQPPTEHRRVLFVGNSLTYVNNLPAAFASLAEPYTKLSVDMIARPGASLVDYANDRVFDDALKNGHYTDVFLQERGGEAVCGGPCRNDPSDLRSIEQATKALADAARHSGARVYYLGTWQALPQMNVSLEFGERSIAKSVGAKYVEIGLTRQKLMAQHPDLLWNHADGQHPGYATTALIALRTWHAVFGRVAKKAPCVGGELYYHAPKPEGVLHIDAEAMPRTCLLSADDARAFSALP